MVTHRKFPFTFEPSEGTNEVRSLIEAVRKVESQSSEPIESKL
jgi:succinate dehydrogenase / fumarate reductase iron-sulfur subunit